MVVIGQCGLFIFIFSKINVYLLNHAIIIQVRAYLRKADKYLQ